MAVYSFRFSAPDLYSDLVSRPLAASIRPPHFHPSLLSARSSLLPRPPSPRSQTAADDPGSVRAIATACPDMLLKSLRASYSPLHSTCFALSRSLLVSHLHYRKLFLRDCLVPSFSTWLHTSAIGGSRLRSLLTLLCPQFLPLCIGSNEHREAQRTLSTHSSPVFHSILDQHHLFLVFDPLHGRTRRDTSLRIAIAY